MIHFKFVISAFHVFLKMTASQMEQFLRVFGTIMKFSNRIQ